MTDGNAASPLLVEMKGIVKRFPGVIALDNVDFILKPGEVHMLLGENGAGKSTLIKVLSGAYIADGGQIKVEGKVVDINSPHAALSRGLRFIYQEINLVQEIDIARNMFLGTEPISYKALGIVDQKTLYKKAEEYLKRFHIELDPHEMVGNLSVTQQKMVEIARALVSEAKVLVLDEPTDVLEDRSRNDLFELIENLKNDGVGFIYISHRYAEAHDLGDRVTILRDGRNEGTYNIEDITLDQMISLMIGREVEKQYPELPSPGENESLRVENLSQDKKLFNISLTVKRGEIVSITGLMGAGKTELGRAIAGIDKFQSGNIFIQGKELHNHSPIHGISNGVAYLTEDRKTLGLILEHSIRDNYGLPNASRLSNSGFMAHKKIDMEITDFMDRLSIKAPGIYTLAGQLSGGNQQKAVLAKWLGTNSKVLIFDEPTRGIDINGRREVYRIMEELLKEGVGILMLTSDYAEALEMGHRTIVLHRGSIAKVFNRGEATEEDILKVAVGVGANNTD
jgi:ribose transport system ATP-binding protein